MSTQHMLSVCETIKSPNSFCIFYRPAEEVVPEAHHACLLLNEQAANATVDSRLRTTPNERLPQVVNDIWYHTQDIAPQRDPSPPPDVPDGYVRLHSLDMLLLDVATCQACALAETALEFAHAMPSWHS